MKNKMAFAAIIALFVISNKAVADPAGDGKTIFISRCAGCHNVNRQLTGPALSGVDQRRSLEWIVGFVHSSQTMIKKGDKDAMAIFEKFNRVPMPDHSDLTEDNIKSIVEYIKAESKPVEANKAPFAKPGKLSYYTRPLSVEKDYNYFILYFFAVALLVIALLFAVRVTDLRRERKNTA